MTIAQGGLYIASEVVDALLSREGEEEKKAIDLGMICSAMICEITAER